MHSDIAGIERNESVALQQRFHVSLRPLPFPVPTEYRSKWDDLERRSLLANPFLSSTFILSQPEQRLRNNDLELLTIERDNRWLAAGLFRRERGTKDMPLPHLVAFPLLHVYKTGLLIDAAEGASTVRTLWDYLRHAGWHGLKFPLFPIGSPLSLLLGSECERRQLAVVTHNEFGRAMVSQYQSSVQSGVSPARRKSLQRGCRMLERHGEVKLTFNHVSAHKEVAIERFLDLESRGWKGREQVSLLSHAGEAASFRQIVNEFARQQRVCFAELSVAQDVIASMCLFRSESDFYAFKIGWSPEFERGCPGFLLGHFIRRHIGELAGCERLDGCARQGSFLDHVWDARKRIADAVFTTTRWGSLAAQGSSWSRHALRRIRKLGGSATHHLASPCIQDVSSTREV